MNPHSEKRQALADLLVSRGLRERKRITAAPGEVIELSRGQRRLWFLERHHPGTAQNNIGLAVDLRHPPSHPQLAGALSRLQSMHGVLCYRFTVERDVPVQRLAPDVPVPLAWHDLRNMPPGRAAAATEQITAAAARCPLDLGDPPLYRAAAVMLPDDQWRLVLVFHHIVVDGWSVGILVSDLAALLGGQDVEPPATTFAQWVADGDDGEAPPPVKRYWRARFADDPPAVTLAARAPHGPGRAISGGLRTVDIGPEVARGVSRLAGRLAVTSYVVCLAAYMTLLRRMGDHDPVVVGSPAAGRDDPALDRVVGFFVRTISLRADISLDDRFADVAAKVQRSVVDALDHQPMPYEELVMLANRSEADGASPLFRSMFGWENGIGSEFDWAGERQRMRDVDTGTSKFDLIFSLSQAPDGIRGSVEWSMDGADAVTAEGALTAFEAILRAVVDRPDLRVGEVPLVADRGVPTRPEVRPTGPGYRTGAASLSLADGFARQVVASPDAIAVVDTASGGTFTYAQLGARIAQAADHIRDLGLRPGDRVALLLERSVDLVVGVHAVTAAGCGYVPIDTSAPATRLEYLLRSADVHLVMVHAATAQLVPGGPWLQLDVGTSDAGTGLVDLRTTAPAARAPAYLLYTSGSTGQPKPVAFPVDAAQAFLDWLQATMPLGEGDRVLLKTPYGFDVSVWELFWPLQHGATLSVAQPTGHMDPRYLADIISRELVNVVNFVPAMLEAFLNEPASASCQSLRWILSAGEQLSPSLRDRVHGRFAGTLVNLYGPTECGAITAHFADRADLSPTVPIGATLPHARIHVVGPDMRPLPAGLHGELCVGGRLGVAIGYWNAPSLTAERFVPDPFSSEPGLRLYRTGDGGRQLPNGEFEYLGRLDRQVKIRGVRIEPAEVECVLAEHPSVRSVRVVALGEAAEQELVAFYTLAPGQRVDDADLRGYAVTRLPGHIVPGTVIRLDQLPVSINGKTDVAALERTWRAHRHDYPAVADPSGPGAGPVREAFEAVLGQPVPDPAMTFFELGGNSFLLLKLATELERRTGYRPGIAELAQHPTVAGLTVVLRDQGAPARLLVPLAPAAGKPHLVLAPPVSGSVLPYIPLSRAIGPELSVYGIEAPGLDGRRTPPGTVAEFVTDMLPVVESLGTARPLVLAGWSFGGVLAYELSVALARHGTAPAATIIMDAWIPAKSRREAAPDNDALEFLRARGLLPAALTEEDAGAIEKMAAACTTAFAAYQPSLGFRHPVHLVRAAAGYPGADIAGYTEFRGWDTVVEHVQVTEVAGDHFGLLSQRHAAQLAEAILTVARQCLGQSHPTTQGGRK